jgi:hypothetical protein
VRTRRKRARFLLRALVQTGLGSWHGREEVGPCGGQKVRPGSEAWV